MARGRTEEPRRARKTAARQSARPARVRSLPRYEASAERTPLPPEAARLASTELPLVGAWITEGWQENRVAGVVIARREPGGRVLAGWFLVDLRGFGLREAWGYLAATEAELTQRLKRGAYVAADYAEARRLLLAAEQWAQQWEFALPQEWDVLRNLIEPPRPGEVLPLELFGDEDGRPLLSGELADLARHLGAEGNGAPEKAG